MLKLKAFLIFSTFHSRIMDSAKQIFINSLSNLPSSNRSELYTKEEIAQKIELISGPVPTDRAGRIRIQRLHLRFKLVPCQGARLLYLRKGEHSQDKRVLSIEE